MKTVQKAEREIVAYAESLGWYVHRRTDRHIIVRHPLGGMVTLSHTASDYRAIRNQRRDLLFNIGAKRKG